MHTYTHTHTWEGRHAHDNGPRIHTKFYFQSTYLFLIQNFNKDVTYPRPKIYDQDMNTWNVHMFIECSYAYRNPKNTRNWFRYDTFIYLFEFKGFSTWGERDTISFYADFSIWTLPRAATPPQTTGLASASSENQLAPSKSKTQHQLTQPTPVAHKVVWPRSGLNLD